MLTILNFDMLTFTAESFLKAMFAHPYYPYYYTMAITSTTNNTITCIRKDMIKNYGQMLEDEKYQREAFQTLLLRQDDRATEIQVK